MRFRGTARAMDVGRIMQDQRPPDRVLSWGGGVGRGFMRVPGIPFKGSGLRDQRHRALKKEVSGFRV